MTKGRVLLVDDDVPLLETLAEGLRLRRYDVDTAESGEQALEKIGEKTEVVVTDLQMAGMDGLEFSRKLHKTHDIPVLMLTGRGTLQSAVEALRAGIDEFLQKPVSLDVLELAVHRAVERHRLRQEVRRLRRYSQEQAATEHMVGASRAMKELRSLVERIAPARVPVLITGESGTGKELVARELHRLSKSADKPFVAINCAAMPASLLESELFGHVRGAFTDAKEDRVGVFKQADGGTLFLDEIGELPISMQPKLLRALQEQRVRPVGGSSEIAFDVRIITATNRELEEEIEEGRFREDLYYRINVVHIPVPPLRARSTDILQLAQFFIERASHRDGHDVRGLSEAASERVLAYAWPGNVRELENAIERGVALSRRPEIALEDLPDKLREKAAPDLDDARSDDGVFLTAAELERRHILRVLEAVGRNKSRAADVLGFDRRTLYRKLERYSLD